jgi:hypothetical protein
LDPNAADPAARPGVAAYRYFVLVTVLAVVGVAQVVLSGRGWNRLYRSLARLTGVTIDAPPPLVRSPGRLQMIAAALTDAVGWRSLGFLAPHAGLMAEGHSNNALAQHLSITERAIEKHVSAIFTKLDLPPSQAHHRRVLAVVTI